MSDVDPVLLLATTDASSRSVLGSELRRRYGGDYEVVVCADYAHARAVLEGLRRWQREVALVIGCYGPADRDGLDFLRRADNVLFIGKPGTGKTGLAMGLLREACLNGYRGRFYNAQVLVDELYASWPIVPPQGFWLRRVACVRC